MIRRRALPGLGLATTTLLARPGLAQTAAFPNRPVRLVVAFPPGGPTDVVARILAECMGRELGQPIIVENRGGANGNIAADAVAKAEADGHVLLYNTSSIAISRSLYRKLPYDVLRDLAPVAMTVAAPSLLVVNPAVPAQDPASFLAWARANSGRISYSSGGIGNISHLLAFMVMRHNGIEATHVPYRGTAAALTDVASGVVQFMCDAFNTALPMAQDGRVRAIALTTRERAPALPDVPTMAESGMMPPDFDLGIWQGIMAPGRTPPAVLARLNAAVNTALADAEVRQRLAAMGADPTGGTAEAYARHLKAEAELWTRVVAESGATAE